MSHQPSIQLEEGWALIVEKGFKPLEACLDGGKEYRSTFKAGDWVNIYTTVYGMCTQRHPQSYAEELYHRVGLAMSSYLVRTALPAVQNLHGQFMLEELYKRWQNHYVMVRWVKKIFDYLDRFHVKRAEKLPLQALGTSCFLKEVFQQVKKDVRVAVLEMIQKEREGFYVDRCLLRNVVFIYVEMSGGELDVYVEELEKPLLEATAQFYSVQAAKWTESCSFPEFLAKAEQSIESEVARRVAYLHAHTEELLLRTCETEILVAHEMTMLEKENSGLVALLEQNKRDDLSRLYRLYSNITVVDGLQPIAAIFRKHIEKDGFALVSEQRSKIHEEEEAAAASGKAATTSSKDKSADKDVASMDVDGGEKGAAVASDRSEFIMKLLTLHEQYNDLVVKCFADSATFQKAMKEAFEAFLNLQIGKTSSAELFANYCDSLLNTGGVGAKMAEEEVEEQLEKIVRLFSFLTEKDVFQEFARKQLAKRLLLERSHSDDAERSLIAKLKLRCGSHYTSKLEGMITDMTLSRDIQAGFCKWMADKAAGREPVVAKPTEPPGVKPAVDKSKASEEAKTKDEKPASSAPMDTSGGMGSSDLGSTSNTVTIEGVDVSMRVLTTGHWPTYKEDKLNLPRELEKAITVFKEYYETRTSQRVLRWVHSLGKCTMDATAFVGNAKVPRVELQLSTHQACIMLLFNDVDELSFGKIRESLGADDLDLIKQFVMSLCKKYPLLIRKSKGKDIRDDEIFALNTKYKPVKRRMLLPTPSAKVNQEEKEATHQSVVEDRKHSIEAAIVRVMKQKKTLDHQSLVVEVSKLLMPIFHPEPKQIKNRIEDLIQREYIKRDDENTGKYEYLA
eukprot:CAMPEP_0184694360 /NCGR_PEP_ID=MMETSP0313-20130426/2360_1 /TAXON_ID=2792 /ORGANISM="Porphyridium aerugineum, Strain SAG 1380-2" /LENGTH=846 /DNA_ID=CAMNT_0027152651 /DNA_START=208 /DNA_END=2748 /DNA_ORIENTATION=-